MLEQPDLVGGAASARRGERLHRAPGGLVLDPTQAAQAHLGGGFALDGCGADCDAGYGHGASGKILITVAQCRSTSGAPTASNVMNRYSLLPVAAAMALAATAASAQAPVSYAADLGRVYGGYQRMLAMKEACDTAVPAARAANDQYRPVR